jgi:hypothetical protein
VPELDGEDDLQALPSLSARPSSPEYSTLPRNTACLRPVAGDVSMRPEHNHAESNAT